MNSLTEILPKYKSLSLESIEKIAFSQRVDTKYIVPSEWLKELLEHYWEHYFVLAINGKRLSSYTTRYYDTKELRMYIDHVRGKFNRYKVRQRNYASTKVSFLEVKFKKNTGQTYKWRIPKNTEPEQFTLQDQEFLEKYLPYSFNMLQQVIQTKFKRISLINNDFTQRITIDFDISFMSLLNTIPAVHLPGLAIIEIKSEQNKNRNGFNSFLKNVGFHPVGFSKYCMGMVMTNTSKLKEGSLKPKILKLNKLIQSYNLK